MIYGLLILGVSCVATASALSPCVCTRDYAPLCASDGRTYSNPCEFNCARATNNDLTMIRAGRCDDTPPPCICTLLYAPVCGTDGNTYPNRCSMECEPKVRLAYQGPCVDEVKVVEQPQCVCTREQREVCGSDGKTYANPCLLKCASATDASLKMASEGPCDSVKVVEQPEVSPPVCACTRDMRPVCGTDGKTYSNPCMLNCAKEQNPSISIARRGPCGNNFVDVSSGSASCACTRELKPVCASDGDTYSSECIMNCRNRAATVIYEGPCV